MLLHHPPCWCRRACYNKKQSPQKRSDFLVPKRAHVFSKRDKAAGFPNLCHGGVPGFSPFGVPERLCGRTGASHPLPDGGLKSCMASNFSKRMIRKPAGMCNCMNGWVEHKILFPWVTGNRNGLYLSPAHGPVPLAWTTHPPKTTPNKDKRNGPNRGPPLEEALPKKPPSEFGWSFRPEVLPSSGDSRFELRLSEGWEFVTFGCYDLAVRPTVAKFFGENLNGNQGPRN